MPTAQAGNPSVVAAETEQQPASENCAALCFVVDEDPNTRNFLSLILIGRGLPTELFEDGESFRRAIESETPNFIFLDVTLDPLDAVRSLLALEKAGYAGAVQLISSRGMAVLHHVRKVGEQHKLNMLPSLKKPFDTNTISKILHSVNLGDPPQLAARFGLDEALSNNWIEFWYQPKIDLRQRKMIGVESFARARHPQSGVASPVAFMPGASEADLAALAERALIDAIKRSVEFSELGIVATISVNMSMKELAVVPIAEVVRANVPQSQKLSGLLIEVTEEQIMADPALAQNVAASLEALNIELAIDDFGRGCSSFMRLKELPFAELKISRAFVDDCAVHSARAPTCRMVIELAHSCDAKATAIGVERARDATALTSMGCDYGQGFLLGQPMPQNRLMSLLKLRASAAKSSMTRA